MTNSNDNAQCQTVVPALAGDVSLTLIIGHLSLGESA